MHGIILRRKAANNICCNDHIWYVIHQKVTDFAEFCAGVLSIHLVENRVRTTLDWHVQKLVDSWMVENVSHGLQMFQNERRISHTKTKHDIVW